MEDYERERTVFGRAMEKSAIRDRVAIQDDPFFVGGHRFHLGQLVDLGIPVDPLDSAQTKDVGPGVFRGKLFAEAQFPGSGRGEYHLIAGFERAEKNRQIFPEPGFACFDRAEKSDGGGGVWRALRRRRLFRNMGRHSGPLSKAPRRGEGARLRPSRQPPAQKK